MPSLQDNFILKKKNYHNAMSNRTLVTKPGVQEDSEALLQFRLICQIFIYLLISSDFLMCCSQSVKNKANQNLRQTL